MEWWDHRGRGDHLENLDRQDLLVRLGQQVQLDEQDQQAKMAQEVPIK